MDFEGLIFMDTCNHAIMCMYEHDYFIGLIYMISLE